MTPAPDREDAVSRQMYCPAGRWRASIACSKTPFSILPRYTTTARLPIRSYSDTYTGPAGREPIRTVALKLEASVIGLGKALKTTTSPSEGAKMPDGSSSIRAV